MVSFSKTKLLSFIIILLMATIGWESYVLAIPSPNIGWTIEPGSLVIDSRFIVYNDGATWLVKDGTGSSGNINAGADCATMIQWALNNLTPGRTAKETVTVKNNCTVNSSILLSSYSRLQIDGKLFGAASLNAPMIWTYTGTNSTGGCGSPCGVNLIQVELSGPGVIDGNNANRPNPTTSSYSGDIGNIQITGAHGVRISGLNVLNAWGTGIHTDASDYVTIQNNYVSYSEDDCIAINQGTFNFTVSNNICLGAGRINVFGAPHCIEVEDGSANGAVTGNSCNWPLNDCYQASTHVGQRAVHDVTITGNSCWYPGTGGVEIISGNTNVRQYDIAVSGTAIANSTSISIVFNRCNGCIASDNTIVGAKDPLGAIESLNGANNIIVGNSIDWSSYYGIYEHATEVNDTISSNIITNSGIAVAGSRVAIGVFGKGTLITGNTLRDTRSGTLRTQQYGIVSYSGSAFVTIQNNKIDNNAVNGVLISAGATSANVEYNSFINNGPTFLASANIVDSGTSSIIKYNDNFLTESNGSVTGLSCTTATVVTSSITHGMQKTPTNIQLSLSIVSDSTARFGGLWTSSIGATTFTANIAVTTAPATCTFSVYWSATAW